MAERSLGLPASHTQAQAADARIMAEVVITKVSAKGEPFDLYTVSYRGEVIGLLRKGKDTKSERFPWQALRPQGENQPSELLGSYWGKGLGREQALKHVVKAYRLSRGS